MSKPSQVIERNRDQALASSGAASYMRDKYSESQKVNKREEVTLISDGILHWPRPVEVLPFTLGLGSLGLFSGAVAFHLNKSFRSSLLIGHQMRFITYVGLVGVCSTMSVGIHYFMIAEKIMENDPKQCSICLQLRASVFQLGMGIAYPLLLAPLMNYTVASSFKARHLPKAYKRPGDVLSYVASVYKPMRGTLAAAAAGQVVLAMGVTYLEQLSFHSKILPVLKGERTFAQPPKNMSPELTLTDQLYPVEKRSS